MATTTNYSWTTPDDTALVKDGAAAIRSLGTAIDTTVFNNAGAAIAKTLIDAEGDLIVGDAADAVQRLAIGSNAQVLTVDTSVDGKIKWATPAAGGKVLQVVFGSTSTETSSTSSTFADTTLTATITPTLATSKILVLANQNGCQKATNDTSVYLRLVRGSTTIADFERLGGQNNAVTTNAYGGSSISYLDTPATTSATTYKTQFASRGNNNIVVVNSANGGISSLSTIVLLEIGA